MLRENAEEARVSRLTAVAVCCLFAVEASGCHHWKGIPKPEVRPESEWADRQVRLRKGDVVRVVAVQRVSYPTLEGLEEDSSGQSHPVALDLRDFDQVEVYSIAPVPTAFLVFGITVVSLALIGYIGLAVYCSGVRGPCFGD